MRERLANVDRMRPVKPDIREVHRGVVSILFLQGACMNRFGDLPVKESKGITSKRDHCQDDESVWHRFAVELGKLIGQSLGRRNANRQLSSDDRS